LQGFAVQTLLANKAEIGSNGFSIAHSALSQGHYGEILRRPADVVQMNTLTTFDGLLRYLLA
jgi:hypothetical protein